MDRSEAGATCITWLARAGYASRSIVYLLVGGLALLTVFGPRDQTTGTRGALAVLADEWWGRVILVGLAAGLLAYGVWQVVQAALNTDAFEQNAKGYLSRAGFVVSALVHAMLAVYAASLLFLSDGSNTDRIDSREATAWLMAQPAGRWLVAAAGVLIVGFGAAQLIKGTTGGFKERLKIAEDTLKVIGPICRAGLMARGFTFLIIGGFFLLAAAKANPSKARGLGGALEAVRNQPLGQVFLIVIAVGLIAFAAHSMIEALCRRVGPGFDSDPGN